MKVIADLHIHSSYSRATSPRLTPPWLERWARIKGIGLLGTGDCTHPLWLEELRSQLDDAEEGFYTLKKEVRTAFDTGTAMAEGLPQAGTETPRFVLTGEISTIYKKGDKTRKVHHVIVLPDFRAAAAFNARLEAAGGNIRSDGRPILGMDSRDLLALLLEADERSLLIPAHIWTPWFSALGEKSGFDSIEECYEDLARYIPAVETGLSSNPPMNWALNSLDKFSIISNSDAHSPDKLGREATIFEMEKSYASLRSALFRYAPQSDILGTIEFFPQEGKYHYEGHRKCGVVLDPEAAAAGNHLCPVCGKALTRGVMGRVLELADRPVNEEEACPPDYANTNRRPYYSLIPLRELCAELLGTGTASKKTERVYYRLIEKGGSEFSILMDLGLKDLEKLGVQELSGEIIAAAVLKMRAGEVSVSPGYDGEYGSVRVFAASVPGMNGTRDGENLFGEALDEIKPSAEQTKPRRKSGSAFVKQKPKSPAPRELREKLFTPDADQEKAISHNGQETIIIAGPGTGKTTVLSSRIERIIQEGADPASILALTFTVKAATELRERIDRLCGPSPLTATTFHSFCCSVLREQGKAAGLDPRFRIIGEEERASLLREIGGRQGRRQGRRLGLYIEERKRYLLLPGEEFPKFASFTNSLHILLTPILTAAEWKAPAPDTEMEALYGEYRKALKSSLTLDFEDLSAGTVRLLTSHPEILELYRQRFRHVFVDEYQDINFPQYLLIRLLSGGSGGPSLWVIGDPNQAIYGFRGSDKRFIDRFLSDYPNAARFELSRSFRCAEPIISAAGQLAETQSRKTSLSGTRSSKGAAEVNLYRTRYATEKSEAEGIARTIETLLGGTSFFAMDSGAAGDLPSGDSSLDPGDCAVLVRTAALAGPIIKALKDHGIPYEFSADVPWWKEEPAGAFLETLRKREKEPKGGVPAVSGLETYIRSAWEVFIKMEKTRQKKKEGEALVERLIGLAGLFGDLPSLLDTLDACAASGIPETRLMAGVRVMTIHASKGLEFDQVFVAGLEEGILPFTLFDRDEERAAACRIEEERRLLYVAMTRAKNGLWLSWADSRLYRGRKLSSAPSRFLPELENIIPLAREKNPRKQTRKDDGQLSLF